MTVDTLPTTTDQLLRDQVDTLVSEWLEQLVAESVAAMKRDPARNLGRLTPSTGGSSPQRGCSYAACDAPVI